MQPDKCKGVWEPSEIHALIDFIESGNFFVRDLPKFEPVKHIAAGADRDTEVFMLIRPLVSGFQVFSLVNKLLPQPFRRRLQIC